MPLSHWVNWSHDLDRKVRKDEKPNVVLGSQGAKAIIPRKACNSSKIECVCMYALFWYARKAKVKDFASLHIENTGSTPIWKRSFRLFESHSTSLLRKCILAQPLFNDRRKINSSSPLNSIYIDPRSRKESVDLGRPREKVLANAVNIGIRIMTM